LYLEGIIALTFEELPLESDDEDRGLTAASGLWVDWFATVAGGVFEAESLEDLNNSAYVLAVRYC